MTDIKFGVDVDISEVIGDLSWMHEDPRGFQWSRYNESQQPHAEALDELNDEFVYDSEREGESSIGNEQSSIIFTVVGIELTSIKLDSLRIRKYGDQTIPIGYFCQENLLNLLRCNDVHSIMMTWRPQFVTNDSLGVPWGGGVGWWMDVKV